MKEYDYINSVLDNESTEINEKISSMDSFVKSLTEYVSGVKEELLKDYIFCETCEAYRHVDKINYSEGEERRWESTYRDAGYGENDEYGYVHYLVKHQQCPYCNNKKEISKKYLYTEK